MLAHGRGAAAGRKSRHIHSHGANPDPTFHPMALRRRQQFRRRMLGDSRMMVEEGEVHPVHVPATEPAMNETVTDISGYVFVHAFAAKPEHNGTKVQLRQ